jgi:hypothetical protein
MWKWYKKSILLQLEAHLIGCLQYAQPIGCCLKWMAIPRFPLPASTKSAVRLSHRRKCDDLWRYLTRGHKRRRNEREN